MFGPQVVWSLLLWLYYCSYGFCSPTSGNQNTDLPATPQGAHRAPRERRSLNDSQLLTSSYDGETSITLWGLGDGQHLITKRTDLETCGNPSNLPTTHFWQRALCGQISMSAAAWTGAAAGVAAIIIGLIKDHDCKEVFRPVGIYDGREIFMKYHTTGRNCDSTITEDQLKDGLTHFGDKVAGGYMCNSFCLKLDHKGTWNGWLVMGYDQNLVRDATCNKQSGPWQSCREG